MCSYNMLYLCYEVGLGTTELATVALGTVELDTVALGTVVIGTVTLGIDNFAANQRT